jgi:phage RecT family recombinase
MTSVATIPADRKGITALLKSEDARARIEPMLRGVEYERVMGEVYLAAGENPEILACTPQSIIRAVARACGWGLVIGEQAYLVPFNVKVSKKGEDDRWEKRLTAIQGYQGKIELILAAGGAKAIRAQVVYAKEPFDYEDGTSPWIKHRPAPNAKDRGPLLGVYAIADHGYNRPPHIKYLTVEEVDADRQKFSKQWKAGPVPVWYMLKTAVHRLAKLLPKNPRMQKALATLEDDENDAEIEAPNGAPAGEPVATIPAPAPAAKRVESGPVATTGEHFLDDRWMEEREPGQEG